MTDQEPNQENQNPNEPTRWWIPIVFVSFFTFLYMIKADPSDSKKTVQQTQTTKQANKTKTVQKNSIVGLTLEDFKTVEAWTNKARTEYLEMVKALITTIKKQKPQGALNLIDYWLAYRKDQIFSQTRQVYNYRSPNYDCQDYISESGFVIETTRSMAKNLKESILGTGDEKHQAYLERQFDKSFAVVEKKGPLCREYLENNK